MSKPFARLGMQRTSRRQLLADRNMAATAQRQWFMAVVALCRQHGGKVRITKQAIESTRRYDELIVTHENGDMVIALDCGNAAKDNLVIRTDGLSGETCSKCGAGWIPDNGRTCDACGHQEPVLEGGQP